jgi:hypothetical protein
MLAAAFGDLFVFHAFIVRASLPHGTHICLSGALFAFMATHLPYGAPHAFLGTQICLSGTPSAFMATHFPYGAPHAFLGAQICLYGTPMPFLAPKFALVAPHLPLWQTNLP